MWAGCIVSLTTPTRSSLRAPISVSSRNLKENSSRVFLASYLFLQNGRSMKDWMRLLKGSNSATIARVETIRHAGVLLFSHLGHLPWSFGALSLKVSKNASSETPPNTNAAACKP